VIFKIVLGFKRQKKYKGNRQL